MLTVEDRAALDGLSQGLPAENRTALSTVGDGILSGQHRTALRFLGHHCVSSLQGTTGHSRQMTIGRGRLSAQNGAVLISSLCWRPGADVTLGRTAWYLMPGLPASGWAVVALFCMASGREGWYQGDVATQHAARDGVRECGWLVCAFTGWEWRTESTAAWDREFNPTPLSVNVLSLKERKTREWEWLWKIS